MVDETDNPNQTFNNDQNDYEWLGTLSQVASVNGNKGELTAPYLDVKINEKSCKALLDTGASVSILSEDIIPSEIDTEKLKEPEKGEMKLKVPEKCEMKQNETEKGEMKVKEPEKG